MTGTLAPSAATVSERITEAIRVRILFTMRLGGITVPISDTVVMTWAVMAIIVAATLLLTRRLRERPGRSQALLEWAVSFAYDFVDGNTHHRGAAYTPFIGSLFIFLAVSNVLPLLTPVGGFGHEAPLALRPLARDINIAASLAVIVLMTSVLGALRSKGPAGWLRSLVRPYPFMLPFNLLEYLVKPTSLSLRLFGNMLGAFIIMLLLEMVAPVVVPPLAGLYFDLFDGALQAVVFTYLSTIYIGEALE